MATLRGGNYLSPEEYRKKIGFASRSNIYRAVKQGRLEHVVIDGNILIPANAVIRDKRIKHGKYVGVRNWVRNEIASVADLYKAEQRFDGQSVPRPHMRKEAGDDEGIDN